MNVHFEDEKETDMVSIMCEMVFDCVSNLSSLIRGYFAAGVSWHQVRSNER